MMRSFALMLAALVAFPDDAVRKHGRDTIEFVWTEADYVDTLARMTAPATASEPPLPLHTEPVGAEYVVHYRTSLVDPLYWVDAHFVAIRLGIEAHGAFWITRRDRRPLPVAECYGNPLAVVGLVLADAAAVPPAPLPLFEPASERLLAAAIRQDDAARKMLESRAAVHKRATEIRAKRAADEAVPATRLAAGLPATAAASQSYTSYGIAFNPDYAMFIGPDESREDFFRLVRFHSYLTVRALSVGTSYVAYMEAPCVDDGTWPVHPAAREFGLPTDKTGGDFWIVRRDGQPLASWVDPRDTAAAVAAIRADVASLGSRAPLLLPDTAAADLAFINAGRSSPSP